MWSIINIKYILSLKIALDVKTMNDISLFINLFNKHRSVLHESHIL